MVTTQNLAASTKKAATAHAGEVYPQGYTVDENGRVIGTADPTIDLSASEITQLLGDPHGIHARVQLLIDPLSE